MKDPVCGMEVAQPPRLRSERNGEIFGFCSAKCKKRFDAGGGPLAMKAPSLTKGYLILASVYAGLIAFALWRNALAGGRPLDENALDFMGAFFLVFGTFKLMDLPGFAGAFSSYDLIAGKSRAYANLYPFIQLVLGVAYLSRWQLPLMNLLAFLVMNVSAAGVLRALVSKRKIRCACLGTRIALPMSAISFAEDITMAVMAGAMLFS
jgi:YHS domain-containing protein